MWDREFGLDSLEFGLDASRSPVAVAHGRRSVELSVLGSGEHLLTNMPVFLVEVRPSYLLLFIGRDPSGPPDLPWVSGSVGDAVHCWVNLGFVENGRGGTTS